MDRNLRIRMLLEAADRATRPLRDIAGGSTRAARALKATRDRLGELEKSQSRIASFRALRQGLGETAAELKQARGRVADLSAAIAASSSPTKKMRTELERAETTVSKLSARQREQAASLRTVRGEFAQSGTAVRQLASVERKLSQDIAHTNTELAEQQRRLQKASDRAQRFRSARASAGRIQNSATGLAAGGLASIETGKAIAAPLVSAAKGAMDLEEAMAGVGKVTGMSQQQLAAMRNRIVDLSLKIPMTSTELANIAAAAGAAGVGMDKFGRPLATQAEDLVAFTDGAARMGIAFDIAADEAGTTMAKWRQAFNLPQKDVESLGDRINALTNKFGGQASAVSDIVTRIGPLGKVAGVAAPQIAALGSMLNSVGVENEIAATGIKNLMLALTKGSSATKSQSDALRKLGLNAEQVSKSMQSNASGTIVDVLDRIGKVRPDQQAGLLNNLFGSESLGAIAPLLTSLDGLKQRLGLVGDVTQYAGSMNAEFINRVNTTNGALTRAGNAANAVRDDFGTNLLPEIKDGSNKFTDLAIQMRAWTGEHPNLSRAAAISGAILAGFFLLIGGLAIVLAGLTAPFAIANAGLIAMGVSGGLASIGLLPILGTIAAIVAGVALLAGVGYLIYANWGGISAWFAGIWKMIVDGFNVGIGGITALLVDFSPRGLLDAGFTALVNWLGGSLPTRFSEAGYNMVAGLVEGIGSGGKWLWDAITGMGTTAINLFKKVLGIHSPSRVFMGLGGYMMQGLTNGIAAGENGPIDRITGLSRQMAAAVAIGTATPAIAATGSPAGAGGGAPASFAAAPVSIGPIHIHAAPGQSEEAIAEAARREVEKALRHLGIGTGRNGYFQDAPDLGDMA